MRTKTLFVTRVAAAAALLLSPFLASGLVAGEGFPPTPVAHGGASVSVFATGLDDPRGLVLGPRGDLFVAEAGTTEGVFVPPPPPDPTEPPTRERCEVYWPVGPATPGFTGRISRIAAGGVRTTVAEGLPSFGANTLIGGDRMGVGAVAFHRGRLHAILAGGGCSHGHLSHPNAVLRVERDGDVVTVADLSEHLRANEDSKDPADGDYEPDGVWYNLVSAFGGLYAVEPNRGAFVRVEADGSVTRVADMIDRVASIDPAGNGDKTFSALAVRGCWFYFGTLGRIDTGFEAAVYRLHKDTLAIEQVAAGLRGVLGLAFDRRGRLHALETTASDVEPPLSDPTAGRLVRIERDGSLTPVVTNLAFPTALLAGRRGELYISNCGYHCDDRSAFPATLPSLRSGQILKVVTK